MTLPATLHVTNAYHAASGGIRTFYDAMLASAERTGRRMCLVVPGPADGLERRGRFARIHHVRAPRSPIVDRRYRLILPHTFLTRDGVLARILRDERPDLVEICDKYALCHLAGMLRRGWIADAGRPAIVGLSCERAADNLGALTRWSWGRAIVQAYLGRIYAGQFHVHLANSEYTAGELRGAMHPRHRRPVLVVPMGVSLDGFAAGHRSAALRAAIGERFGLSEPFDLLLYVGRLAREKNLSLLVDTIAALDDRPGARCIRLVVAGSGPLESELAAALAARAPGRAALWGHVHDRRALAALYASADAFLHPNPREPFGIAPLEAMASGLALVAPRAGGILTYANDRNAWLAVPAADEMASAVRAALTQGTRRARRRAKARETAARFDWAHVCRRIFAIYDAIHAQHADSSAVRLNGFDDKELQTLQRVYTAPDTALR